MVLFILLTIEGLIKISYIKLEEKLVRKIEMVIVATNPIKLRIDLKKPFLYPFTIKKIIKAITSISKIKFKKSAPTRKIS